MCDLLNDAVLDSREENPSLMIWSIDKQNSNKHPLRHRIKNPVPLAQISSLSRVSNPKALFEC